ncbi:type II secretion system F family protein [Pararhodobacter sp.]|uniref:type II secretion system F family protein n=1 Tax=Pararhodobacter sp. TaxID=2127056 RepID=UPI002AFF2724|nr:type II secretion system F family protein [Pararhodobacter sp.]
MMQSLLISGLIGLSVYAGCAALTHSSKDQRIKELAEGLPTARQERVNEGGLSSRQVLASNIVQALSLKRWLGLEELREKLARAGRRGPHAETAFIMARFLCAIALGLGAIFYLLFLNTREFPLPGTILFIAGAIWVGLKLPGMSLERAAAARLESIKSAWPDALDLMLIMIEAGKPLEQTWRRVSEEIGGRSQPLAEELNIALTELAFLPDRRQAFLNLGRRVDLPEVRSTTLAIIQAELQGTSLGTSFMALASEGRAARLIEAESKGAKASTLQTLPLVIFFLPPFLITVSMPMVIQFMEWN